VCKTKQKFTSLKMYNESHLVALLFVLSCIISLLILCLQVYFTNPKTQEPQPSSQRVSWLHQFTTTVNKVKRIDKAQSLAAPRYFFSVDEKIEKCNELDRLPAVVAFPFRVVDTVWDSCVEITALSIKTTFYPQILAYRFIKRCFK
jgi:hypothetical protein